MGRIRFQELCIEKADWDEQLPAKKREGRETLLTDAQPVKLLTVPRTLHEPEGDMVKILFARIWGCFSPSKFRIHVSTNFGNIVGYSKERIGKTD